jgi:hypothetical protein
MPIKLNPETCGYRAYNLPADFDKVSGFGSHKGYGQLLTDGHKFPAFNQHVPRADI